MHSYFFLGLLCFFVYKWHCFVSIRLWNNQIEFDFTTDFSPQSFETKESENNANSEPQDDFGVRSYADEDVQQMQDIDPGDVSILESDKIDWKSIKMVYKSDVTLWYLLTFAV